MYYSSLRNWFPPELNWFAMLGLGSPADVDPDDGGKFQFWYRPCVPE